MSYERLKLTNNIIEEFVPHPVYKMDGVDLSCKNAWVFMKHGVPLMIVGTQNETQWSCQFYAVMSIYFQKKDIIPIIRICKDWFLNSKYDRVYHITPVWDVTSSRLLSLFGAELEGRMNKFMDKKDFYLFAKVK